MAERKRPKKKRGLKGGVKHQPGRGRDRKSAPAKKKKFERQAARKRDERRAEARRQWEQWDALTAEQKKILHDLAPKLPRPEDF
jgi:hypothetical protein